MITLLHPGALWLLTLCVIPPILHLLNRHPQKRIRFPLTHFLLPSHAAHQGRRQLRELLLMALRMLLLAALALLLASPQWQKIPDVLTVAEKGTRRAVIIDTSASMNAPDRYQQAQKYVRSLSSDNCECALFTTARVREQNAKLSMSDDFAFGYAAGNPSDAVAQALSWLNASGNEVVRELVIISDLQSGEWGQSLPSGGEELKVTIHKLPAVVSNAGITGVAVNASANGKTRVMATVRNFGMQPQERAIQLYLGDAKIDERGVMIPAKGEVREVFMIDDAASPIGRIVLTHADELHCDDERFFFAGRAPLPMVVVANNAISDKEDSAVASRLIATALSAHADGQNAPCEVLCVASNELPSVLKSAPDALILTEVPDFPDAVQAVKTYVEAGGTLLYMPAVPALAQWRQLNHANIFKSVPLSLQKRTTGIAQLSKESSLNALFGAPGTSDLFECIIQQWLQVKCAKDSTALMSFEDNSPALLRERTGSGEVFAATFGIARDASDLPLSTSFLPLIREILLAGRVNKAADEFVCGDTLPPEIAANTDGLQPGVVNIAGRKPIVFNPPLSESILEYCQPDEIIRQLTRPIAGEDATTHDDATAPRDLRALLIVLIMLLSFVTVRR